MKKYFEFNQPFKKFLPLFTIMLAIILLLSTSYAVLLTDRVGKNNYVMNVANLEVTFINSETNALTLENAVPMSDYEGQNQKEELVFKIKNTGDLTSNYSIYIEEVPNSETERLDFKSKIKFISNKNNTGYNDIKILSQDNYIDRDVTIEVGESVTYSVKAWLDEYSTTSEYMKKTYKTKIVVQANQVE